MQIPRLFRDSRCLKVQVRLHPHSEFSPRFGNAFTKTCSESRGGVDKCREGEVVGEHQQTRRDRVLAGVWC